MNKQEAFDAVCEHLLVTQKQKCMENQRCLYRYKGLKCAIGALIPDDQYKPEFDFNDGGSGVMYTEDVCKAVPALEGLDVSFIKTLQMIHDNANVDQWRTLLAQFAGNHGLYFDYHGET